MIIFKLTAIIFKLTYIYKVLQHLVNIDRVGLLPIPASLALASLHSLRWLHGFPSSLCRCLWLRCHFVLMIRFYGLFFISI
jgi:hypothetical protein